VTWIILPLPRTICWIRGFNAECCCLRDALFSKAEVLRRTPRGDSNFLLAQSKSRQLPIILLYIRRMYRPKYRATRGYEIRRPPDSEPQRQGGTRGQLPSTASSEGSSFQGRAGIMPTRKCLVAAIQRVQPFRLRAAKGQWRGLVAIRNPPKISP
jgi:hypothetical protein